MIMPLLHVFFFEVLGKWFIHLFSSWPAYACHVWGVEVHAHVSWLKSASSISGCFASYGAMMNDDDVIVPFPSSWTHTQAMRHAGMPLGCRVQQYGRCKPVEYRRPSRQISRLTVFHARHHQNFCTEQKRTWFMRVMNAVSAQCRNSRAPARFRGAFAGSK